MRILVCRSAWMETYQNVNEPAYSTTGWVFDGNTAYEAWNFKPDENGQYYGFTPMGTKKAGSADKNINIEKLGASPDSDYIEGITVVFVAPSPRTQKLLVVGFFKNATVYKEALQRPDREDEVGSIVRFTSKNAVLIPEAERCFLVPRAPEGGIGTSSIWYGVSEPGAPKDLYKQLVAYLDDRGVLPEKQESVKEYRAMKIHSRLERKGNVRRFIYEKGFTCESCEWTLDDSIPEEFEIWKSSFELHHLEPVANLKEGETREVSAESFAVLCSACHKAIHQSEYIDDVSGFVEKHPIP